mmetsp:Transcript_19898/g.35318  ORF Transcript_19898/g.35318 Transcript_19898/m.35318 type:complete len:112 (-) Transcript_19898:66-401(-)
MTAQAPIAEDQRSNASSVPPPSFASAVMNNAVAEALMEFSAESQTSRGCAPSALSDADSKSPLSAGQTPKQLKLELEASMDLEVCLKARNARLREQLTDDILDDSDWPESK